MARLAPDGRSARVRPKRIRHPIPKPDAPGALAVSDGTMTVGHVVEHDGSVCAFDITDTLVGKFETQTEAMRALPDIEAGFPLPERNQERVGRVFPKRKPQRRPHRQCSLERRKRLANGAAEQAP